MKAFLHTVIVAGAIISGAALVALVVAFGSKLCLLFILGIKMLLHAINAINAKSCG